MLSIVNSVYDSAVSTGLPGAVPTHIGLLKVLFLEHRIITKQQTMMEKEIITFKYSHSAFS